MSLLVPDPSLTARDDAILVGSDLSKRLTRATGGAGLLVIAGGFVALAAVGPRRAEAILLALAGVVGVTGLVVLGIVLFCRTRRFAIRPDGIRLDIGGDQLLHPWAGVEWLGARPAGPERVRLIVRFHALPGLVTLPGGGVDLATFHRLIDHLQETIAPRHPRLKLGEIVS